MSLSVSNLNNYLVSHSYDDDCLFLSVVVPIYNEAENIKPLIDEIMTVLADRVSYEIVYVDDGSTDASWQQLQKISADIKCLRAIRHRRSYGQSIALLTGVKVARAQWIVTLDGDGQNDPADIPRLLAMLPAPNHRPPHLQLIAGVRHQRQDKWLKRMASKWANAIRRRLLRDEAVDTGCSLKLFAKQTFLALPHFNHMHRFLHALFLRHGGSIVSVTVNHRPRQYGQSKYGFFDRLGMGIIDLLGVMWLQRRHCRAEIREDLLNNE
jgi:dolichol-phosphate mannosyltransferase